MKLRCIIVGKPSNGLSPRGNQALARVRTINHHLEEGQWKLTQKEIEPLLQERRVNQAILDEERNKK